MAKREQPAAAARGDICAGYSKAVVERGRSQPRRLCFIAGEGYDKGEEKTGDMAKTRGGAPRMLEGKEWA